MGLPPSSEPELAPGTIVAERFVIVKRLASGFAATVYSATDQHSGAKCALKVWHRPPSGWFPGYTEHLAAVYASLRGKSIPHVLTPITFGSSDQFFWEALPWMEHAQGLSTVLTRGPIDVRTAIPLLARVAEGIEQLHARGFIHGDIKPANILVSNGNLQSVQLIDFGMVTEVGDRALVVGTYRYMAPPLRRSLERSPLSSYAALAAPRSGLGPFVDVYAFGVTAIEILTGWVDVASFAAHTQVRELLLRLTPGFDRLTPNSQADLANLLFATFLAEPDRHPTIAELRTTLEAIEGDPYIRSDAVLPIAPLTVTAQPLDNLDRLEKIADTLVQLSQAFIVQSGSFMVVTSDTSDAVLLAELMSVFENAKDRTRYSWRVTAGMAAAAFLVTTSMIVSAIVSSLVTGNSQWALLFGGVSAVTVLGTLWWRPFDRMFRATIISQNIELIHAQTIAVFRSTTDFERRNQAFQEALLSLRTLLRDNDGQDAPKD
jgi:serine/threonine protein kinase